MSRKQTRTDWPGREPVSEHERAQEAGRLDGMYQGRRYVDWLREYAGLAQPYHASLIDLNGENAGYALIHDLYYSLERVKPSDRRAYAMAYGVNFCQYYDSAVIRLTSLATWEVWYSRAEIAELFTRPYLAPDVIHTAWPGYKAGRFTQGLPAWNERHPECHLPPNL